MDFADKQSLAADDFFEESLFATRLFSTHRELSDHLSDKQPLDFNIEDSFDHFIIKEQMPLPQPLHFDECKSIRNALQADDTKQFDNDSQQSIKMSEFPYMNPACDQNQESVLEELCFSYGIQKEQAPSIEQIQQFWTYARRVVAYLVEHSHQSVEEVRSTFPGEFRAILQSPVVLDLVQKFGRLKKTREELVKYCMRKAFKFILQLPKNKHLLEVDREEKFSFSKCKNRYLRNISEEKSMNNKFLQQVFQQKDFSADYQLFLVHFDRIIEDDNYKKVRYLAELLTTEKQGKIRTVEMVRRLPWTRAILERVRKISRELLKYSAQR